MEWIKVSERLPEIGKAVLFFFESGGIFMGYRSEDEIDENVWIIMFDTFNSEEHGTLSHWQSLPTPPID